MGRGDLRQGRSSLKGRRRHCSCEVSARLKGKCGSGVGTLPVSTGMLTLKAAGAWAPRAAGSGSPQARLGGCQAGAGANQGLGTAADVLRVEQEEPGRWWGSHRKHLLPLRDLGGKDHRETVGRAGEMEAV